MRTRFLVLLFVALVLAACGSDRPTLIAGDSVADAADEPAPVSDDAGSVAEDSAPIEVGPTTTAPWDVTLVEYPLLRVLDETQNDAQIGSARFILVDDTNQPRASGSIEFPEFYVQLDAWYGVSKYIEFTIRTANVEIVDGEVAWVQCGNNWSTLSQLDSGRFQRIQNTLPDVKGTNLGWDSFGCEPLLAVDFDRLFEGEIAIEVTDSGFLLTAADALGETYRFEKLDPPSLPSLPAPPIDQTTIARQTTTTTAQPAD